MMKLCLHEQFSKAAQKAHAKPAVIDYNENVISYGELDHISSVLATNLRLHGCKTDSIVGIYMERCIEYPISLIAALKAGGAYLPIEYSYPIPLLNSVLADSNPLAVITLPKYKKWLPDSMKIICLGEGWVDEIEKENKALQRPLTPKVSNLQDLAYVVYSSGTTGRPKGIMCPHRGAVFSYEWRHKNYPYKDDARVACNVFFVWEMLRPLLKGIPMYVIPDHVIYDPVVLLSYLHRQNITHILFTPSLLETILDTADLDLQKLFSSLCEVWLCGEVVTMTLRNRFVNLFPEIKLLNLYSISECHDVAAADLSLGMLDKELEDKQRNYCPVGHVLEGVEVVILDDHLSPLPIGMPGQIYVGGPTLARSYVNRPELTLSRFIERPMGVSESAGDRLYGTGDWGYKLSNGQLEICKRCDSMVKIRGFSVELKAIESALLDLDMIKACTVLAHGDEGSDKFVVAYVVPNEKIQKREIRAALKFKLPSYMIPSYFVLLTSVPVAISGKLDLKILPKFDKNREQEDIEGRPNGDTETFLHDTWKRILQLNIVDTQENFFDLGGHSLLAARMLGQVREKYNVEVNMSELFVDNTIVSLANLIDVKCGRDIHRVSIQGSLDLLQEVEYHDQSFINMDMMLRAFWRSCQYGHRWSTGRVLLTGSTGYLGAFILKDLLTLTKTHIYCIVRERPDSTAKGRLERNLRQYGIIAEENVSASEEQLQLIEQYKTRVTVVKGDVSLRNFGLNDDDYAHFSFEIDFVIHCAAAVNLIYPYQALHGTNVGGTQNILMFACSCKIKPVHYISTNAVFPSGFSLCKEDVDMTKHVTLLVDGYSQSKWVAEQLVLRAAKRGLPAAVYRLGNLSGESRNAYWNPNDFNLLMLLGCIHSKYAPNIDWAIEMTPVDFVSRSIVTLTQQISWSLGKIHHIINNNPIDSKHFLEWISTHGYPLKVVKYELWKDMIKEASKTTNVYFFEQLLQLLEQVSETFFATLSTYENANFVRFLETYQKEKYPAIDGFLLKTYLHELAERNIIPKPSLSKSVARQLTGQVAIVIGASSGIGESIARALASAGSSVVLGAREVEKLEAIRNNIVEQGDTAIAMEVDVTSRKQVFELIKTTEDTLGSVDILINCAGVMYYTYMKNFHLDEWEHQVDVNCKGVINTIGAVLPGMLKNESGHIINITSDASRKVYPGLAVYSASKFFVEGLSRGLRLETANKGIKVTTIRPGDVKTNLLDLSTDKEAKEDLAPLEADILLEPKDVANAVLFAVTQPKNCSVSEIIVEPGHCRL